MIDEVEITSEEELQKAQDRRIGFRDLIKSYGWDLLSELLEEQIRQREAMDKALDLVTSEHALEQLIELRAERRMLQMVLNLPELIINTLTEEIENESKRRTD